MPLPLEEMFEPTNANSWGKIIIVLILQKIIKMVLKITGFGPFSLTSYLPFSSSEIQMFVPPFFYHFQTNASILSPIFLCFDDLKKTNKSLPYFYILQCLKDLNYI